MKSLAIGIFALLLTILVIKCQAKRPTRPIISSNNFGSRLCQEPENGQHICFCGDNKLRYNRLNGEKCINGRVISRNRQKRYINFHIRKKN